MRRVYVEFESHQMADEFADALMDWLTEEVVIRQHFKNDELVAEVKGPRHWAWADADVCAENVSDEPQTPRDQSGEGT